MQALYIKSVDCFGDGGCLGIRALRILQVCHHFTGFGEGDDMPVGSGHRPQGARQPQRELSQERFSREGIDRWTARFGKAEPDFPSRPRMRLSGYPGRLSSSTVARGDPRVTSRLSAVTEIRQTRYLPVSLTNRVRSSRERATPLAKLSPGPRCGWSCGRGCIRGHARLRTAPECPGYWLRRSRPTPPVRSGSKRR